MILELVDASRSPSRSCFSSEYRSGLAFIGPSLIVRASPTAGRAGFALKTAFDGLNSFPLLAVPLFILVGCPGQPARHRRPALRLLPGRARRVRGNLAYVNVGSAVGFSWMSGSALADVAGLGKMQIPQMVRAGYPYGFAARAHRVVVAHQPGDAAEHPGRHLRRDGGRLDRRAVRRVGHPGVAHGAGPVSSTSSSGPEGGPTSTTVPFRLARRLTDSVRSPVIGPLFTPVILLGGILSGMFTPTEAASVAVALHARARGLIYRTARLEVLLAVR